ncbi:MAG: pyrroloquinoline quinone-dependent dehydrogenase, partial [Myxococcota bacterium]
PASGNDPGGMRYAPLSDITPENVQDLEEAWRYRTGDVSDGRGETRSTSAFQATPILVRDTLYLCTPFNRVIALDPRTGSERWTYDPEIPLAGARYANQLVCRGVSFWRDPDPAATGPCRERIFTATNDARLIALDAVTGRPCSGFGRSGIVDLARGVGPIHWKGEYQVTSPPTLVGDVVVVGSAVSDNYSVDAPSGVLRGFDARSGERRWAFDLAPPGIDRKARSAGEAESEFALGTPNVWAPMSVDPERGLVFVATGNPSPDYFRGDRAIDHYGSSVIALRGASGEVVWHFQTVHHDLWDYDLAAQPTLFSLRRGGEEVPALAQATKMGLVFLLHRETGVPLFPVEERPVPQGGVPEERLSPTQPFPVKPPPLVRTELRPEDAWGITPLDRRWCRKRIESLRNDGIYTPPTLQGSIMYPGNAGGVNWGGVAVDPARQLLVTNTIDAPWIVRLLPRVDYEAEKAANPGVEISPQIGTPYAMRREIFLSPIGLPCSSPPWGTLVAVDLASGDIRWQIPFGTVRDIAPIPLPLKLGTASLGAPVLTASGLAFIGAAQDDYLRAFDVESGEELWHARLPAGGQATPMTYRIDGRQYVVLAAGGHFRAQTTLGDYLIAWTLPDD